MKLLNLSNFYAFYASEKCNFNCSYCVAGHRRNSESILEHSSNNLVAFFNSLDDGLIIASGGEPGLAKNMQKILSGLEKHSIAYFTNLSVLPQWYRHIINMLFIATYHEECISEKNLFKVRYA